MQLCFPVLSRWQGWPLRDVLRQCGVSSTMIRRVKRAGGFWLNGQPVHTNQVVSAGQQICFDLPAEPPTSVQPQALPLNIAYQDEHTLVLDKPAGMAVHPTLNYADGTLANAWMGWMCSQGRQGVFRPVNRIDRNTSGLVLCAQNAFSAPLLAASVQKNYYAIVQGEMPLGTGFVEAPIGRAPDSIILRRVSPEGKPSRTEYTVLASGAELSLLRVVPVTGRTHQIRVHMAHIGHPLAGDDLYGGSQTLMARHALHCGVLTFAQPITDLPCRVCSPLPQDMADLTVRMGLDSEALAAWNLAPHNV